ncbi:MAG: putative manganese transporter [Myxococcota bacterium]
MVTRTPDDALASADEGEGFRSRFRIRRILLAVAMLLLAVAPGELGATTRQQLVDAFVAVSSFVGGTLMLFYGLEKLFGVDVGQVMTRARAFQVPIAALLGVTPGCGGAVVVVAAHASGRVGFGAVVAALTATMGDAAFLLIASRPKVAAFVLPLALVVGMLTGWIVDALPHPRFVTARRPLPEAPSVGRPAPRHWGYVAVLVPGLGLGIAQLAGVEMSEALVSSVALVGVAMGAWVWATSPLRAMTSPQDPAVTRAAEETAFISVAVALAFLTYAYATDFLGLDLRALFAAAGPWLILAAILVGFIPGCGPQILVTTLYIQGLVPLAALVGNAIANDGDALFPAIALHPRVAILATLYTSVPAVIVAYVLYYFGIPAGW